MRRLLPAIAGLLFATAAGAATLTPWRHQGDWRILVDTDANTCLMQRNFDDGSRLRIGSLPERKGGFFSISSKEWTDLGEGDGGDIRIHMDTEVYGGDAETVVDGDWRGTYAFFNNPEFWEDFAKRNSLTVERPGIDSTRYSLTGSANALTVLTLCDNEIEEK